MKSFIISLAAAIMFSTNAFAAKAKVPAPVLATLQITLEDNGNYLNSTTRTLLKSNLDAAFHLWTDRMNTSATVTAVVRITDNTVTKRIDCASTTNIEVKSVNGVSIREESAAYKLRTKLAVTPGQADLVIQIDPIFLTQEMWFDPRPQRRIDSVPSNKNDAVSLFAHELGHAFGIQSFRNLETGVPVPGYLTVYDQYVSTVGAFSFIGPNTSQFGGITLTMHNGTQNIKHFADSLSDPFAADLMNGLEFWYGYRYSVTSTDLAVMKDLGLPVK